LKRNPDLAGSFAKLAAIGKKVETDCLNSQQPREIHSSSHDEVRGDKPEK